MNPESCSAPDFRPKPGMTSATRGVTRVMLRMIHPVARRSFRVDWSERASTGDGSIVGSLG